MATIQKLTAHEILDSRGEPTIAVDIELAHARGVASVPSGASVGVHEALELRDKDMTIHHGRGVSKAISHIQETIAHEVVGKDFDQKQLDSFLCELDGTPNKGRLGANAILGVSIAFARAKAEESGMELYAYIGSLDSKNTFSIPQPLFNILNGGKHVRRGIDIQECMIAPIRSANMESSISMTEACIHTLKSLLEQKGYSTNLGDEGGFAPDLTSNDEALDILVEAITRAGYSTEDIRIALDIAASSFYKDGSYTLQAGGTNQTADPDDMLTWYIESVKKYPLISIEDGFAEDDWENFIKLQGALGATLHIVGDDLTVTNVARIEMAAAKKAANACIIKPNQVGTLTEAIDAVRAARHAGWKVFASHRSGETMDSFIADFAVGLSCDYLKAGAPTKEERMIKYSRLATIEKQLLAI